MRRSRSSSDTAGVHHRVAREGSGIRGESVKLIDFDDPDKDDWLAVIELKNPAGEKAGINT